MKRTLIFILAALFITQQVTGQTVQEADKALAGRMEQISYWRDNHDKDNSDGDSLSNANGNLETYISTTCTKLPIDAHFPLAEENRLVMATSTDHKIRVYSWDTRMGGTQYNYSSVIVAKTKNGTSATDIGSMFFDVFEGDTSAAAETYYYYKIADIRGKGNSITYLFFGMQTATRYRGEQVFACKVLNDTLVRVPVFKTKTKAVSEIGYYYDLFAFGDKNKNGDPPVIHLSKDSKKLYIPIVASENITNKYLVYVFDGNRFVFAKDAK